MPLQNSKRWLLRTSTSRHLISHPPKDVALFSYEILSDPESREAYDRYGIEGIGGGHGPGSNGMDPNDIFAELFGGGAGMRFDFGGMGGGMPGGYSRRSKGQDSVIPYEVTLEDLYNGKSVKMMMEKEIVCGVCKGYATHFSLWDFPQTKQAAVYYARSGAKGNAKPKKCVKCEGKGWTHVQTPVSVVLDSLQKSLYEVLDRYHPRDWEHLGLPVLIVMVRVKSYERRIGMHHAYLTTVRVLMIFRCKKCKGDKTVKDKKRQEIFVERGMSDGQRIVLAGAGDQQVCAPGNAYYLLSRPLKSQSSLVFLREMSYSFSNLCLTSPLNVPAVICSPP